MSKKVFLNTSPIQYIHQLGLIRIIKELFGKVYVPAEVHEELNRGREEGIELPNLKGWILSKLWNRRRFFLVNLFEIWEKEKRQ